MYIDFFRYDTVIIFVFVKSYKIPMLVSGTVLWKYLNFSAECVYYIIFVLNKSMYQQNNILHYYTINIMLII